MDLLICTHQYVNENSIDGYKKKDVCGPYEIWSRETTGINHYNSFWTREKDYLYIKWGTVYEPEVTEETEMPVLIDCYEKNSESIVNIDGEFIFAKLEARTGKIVVFSDREGIMPIFYRETKEGLLIATECRALFYDYCEADIDLRSVNDFLRFGTLVGNRTMSKKVKLLQGGAKLQYASGKTAVKRYYKFHYQEDNNQSIEKIAQDVSFAYKKAIQKRMRGKEKDTCIFLSGGMDSRFLLAMTNLVCQEKIYTYSFGQALSEEVDVAEKCARKKGNPFRWIAVNAADFVENAERYESMVCGADTFPQGYILKAVEQIEHTHFITGFALDAYMGGTFLNEDAINTEQELSEFVKGHLKLLKMNVLSMEELKELSLDTTDGTFWVYDTLDLEEEAENYRDVSVKDAIQAFAIDTRAKRLVLCREVTPAAFMDCSYVSTDKVFLEAVSRIPAKWRNNHKFYQKMFSAVAPEYADIVYNNTTLPISAPIEMWQQGSGNEANRERMYEKILETYNADHKEKMYYPHYYSDFNGYSKYDEKWKALFQKYLLKTDSFICRKWFSYEKIKQLYQEHLEGKMNRRKELIYLTSLEIFMKNAIHERAGRAGK